MKKNFLLILLACMAFSITAIAQNTKDTKTEDKPIRVKKTVATKKTKLQGESNSNGAITKTFKVYGNCGMCKRSIENAVANVDGIAKGEWNMEKGEMTVTFDVDLISFDSVKQRIADVGYDSDSHKAKDEVYNGLPGCCKYERFAKIETVIASTEIVDNTMKKVNFMVYGNCGMCERAIEFSIKDLDGITLADWNMKDGQMTVSYNPDVITLDTIKQKIADRGYDSDTHRAKTETYNQLPGCCKYKRPN